MDETTGKLRSIWRGMKSRCTSKTGNRWKYYGSLGIQVCQEWQDFEAFKSWALANGYKPGLEIDRRESTKNYEPENCRWATHVQQMRNRKKKADAKTSKYKGISWRANVGKWRVQLFKDGKPIHCGLFADEVDAAKRYDEEATRVYGEFAKLNFPVKECVSC